MLPDQGALLKEVNADIKQVRDIFERAMNDAEGTPAQGAIVGLQANVDAWAKRGLEAAQKVGGTPSPNGWPGWTNAGTQLMSGLPDIAKEGKNAVLSAVIAQSKDAPAVAIKTVQAAAKKVADGAHSAEHAIVAVGAGVAGFGKQLLLYGAAVLVLIALLKKAV